MALTHDQINALLQPLDPGRVRQVKGNAHLEAWDVRRHLLRVFGWGGWDFTVQSCDLVAQLDLTPSEPNGKTRYTVVYRVIGRLTIKDNAGDVLAVFEDGATGDAQNQPALGDAHDMALKTAMSQCLKRCAMNLGDRYGLGLYNGGKTAAVVGKTLAHPDTTEVAARDEVTGGEMVTPEPTPAPTNSPARAAVPAVSTPVENDTASSAPSPDAAVDELRGRVIDAMNLDRRHATITFAKLQAEIAKAGLSGAMTTSPGGSAMTLGALVNQALDIVSRQPEPGGGNAHADAAAGERQEDVA